MPQVSRGLAGWLAGGRFQVSGACQAGTVAGADQRVTEAFCCSLPDLTPFARCCPAVAARCPALSESLVPGKPLAYGVSITDGCIGWDESRGVLEALAEGVRKRRLKAVAKD